MIDRCPICEKELGNATGIGAVCITKDCPVSDDALLWSKGENGEPVRVESEFKIKMPRSRDELETENALLKDTINQIIKANTNLDIDEIDRDSLICDILVEHELCMEELND